MIRRLDTGDLYFVAVDKANLNIEYEESNMICNFAITDQPVYITREEYDLLHTHNSSIYYIEEPDGTITMIKGDV